MGSLSIQVLSNIYGSILSAPVAWMVKHCNICIETQQCLGACWVLKVVYGKFMLLLMYINNHSE